MALSHCLAASQDLVSWGPALSQLGIGALVAVPSSTGCLVLWRAWQKERDKNELLQLARIQDAKDATLRERELSNTVVPMLSESSQLLATVPVRFEQALAQASDATRAGDLERAVKTLLTSAEQLKRGT